MPRNGRRKKRRKRRKRRRKAMKKRNNPNLQKWRYALLPLPDHSRKKSLIWIHVQRSFQSNPLKAQREEEIAIPLRSQNRDVRSREKVRRVKQRTRGRQREGKSKHRMATFCSSLQNDHRILLFLHSKGTLSPSIEKRIKRFHFVEEAIHHFIIRNTASPHKPDGKRKSIKCFHIIDPILRVNIWTLM